MDCGETIEIGDIYWITQHSKKKYIYCKPCKDKPEHQRLKYDPDEIISDLKNMPLFKHEFMEKYEISATRSNDLIRRLMFKGYPIRRFHYRMRSRITKYLMNKKYRLGFQPNDFVIYYVEGTENKVVRKIMDEFEFNNIRWRDLLASLYARKIPIGMSDRDSVLEWANQNVYI